jgi:hypothetical protein
MMNILNPPSASEDKATKSTDVEATAASEDENLTTILSEIDRLISDVVAEKELAAVVSNNGKKIEETVAEPPELFQLKCLSHASGAVTHLNRNNPSVPQI